MSSRQERFRDPRSPTLARRAPGPSSFDAQLARLRHRWETDPRYRARVSVISGSAALLTLCALVAIVATVANAAFAGSNSGSGVVYVSGDATIIAGAPDFPTATIPPWTPGAVPNAQPVPNSGTPMPSPTTPPSPTAPPTTPTVPGATPGPPTGGGPLPTTCNGGAKDGSATWALAPCPQQAGQGGTLTISAPGHAGASLNILINFGVCSGGASCTLLFTPGTYSLDGSGTARIGYTAPAAAASNTVPISGMINIGGGPTLSISAAPVH
jgi:hypothetical protein